MDDTEPDGGLADVLAMLRYRAKMIASTVVVFVCVAIVSLLFITPRYTATTAILLDPVTTSELRATGGEFSSSPVDAAKVASVAAVIASSEFLDQIVKVEGLIEDPEFVGGPPGVLTRAIRFITGRPLDSRSEPARVAKAAEALRKSMTVARDGLTYVIRIDLVSTDAEKAMALVQKIAETYVSNRAEARIISPARMPEAPSFPRTKWFLLAALGIGLVGGAGAAFLIESSANCVTTPDQIERSFKLPVLACAPLVKDKQLEQGLKRVNMIEYMANRPFSQFAESMRNVRVGLRYNPKRSPRIVQFASPMPSEGKSTVAACVAVSLAIDGMRTILIDCDLRHSFSADIFKVRNRRGVADVLMGLASFDEVLAPTSEHFLRVIPPGKVTRSPPDLTNSTRLQRLIEAASAAADFVIIDSPPLEVALDAAIISQIADTTIIVVKWRVSDRTLVARAIEQIHRAQGRVAGIVLNGIDMKTATHYGYWNKDYVRTTSEYYAGAEARGVAGQTARDTL